MHLKSLTAVGFKSFPDRISLTFQPGITAIVGPNGCGKSNIADAVRWALGEQSAKALRGEEMSDVIFNGTDARPKMGFAEISLTIEGVEEACLKAAGVPLPYHEVTVTRRVFRDGGSEYFLNKTPCRLKDIQQLFMGTGVGRASYSIMAQGAMTQILSSKPEDRRAVFEEAAGVTKFKAQKRETLRKLENTEQNLVRLEDVIREVRRQIISLQRQAGTARRYTHYQTEIQHLDTQLARHQFDSLQSETYQCQERLEAARSSLEGCSSEVDRIEEQVNDLREQLSVLDAEISAARQRELETKAECDRHGSRIQFNQEKLRELMAQDARAFSDIALAQERRLATEQELAGVNERLKASVAHLGRLREEMESRRQALAGIETSLQQSQDKLRREQDDAFSTAQELTRVRNEAGALDFQKQANRVRLEKLSAEKIQLEEERGRLERRLEEFARDSALHGQSAEAQRIALEERRKRLEKTQNELGNATEKLDGLQRLQAEQHSRLGVLRQLEDSHEGFGAGAVAALKGGPQVLGTLVEHLRVQPEYVTAIESALGHQLQIVLTDQPEAACGILADLARNKKGFASLASLALRNGESADLVASIPPAMASKLAAIGSRPALDVVEADQTVKRLVVSLLGSTQVVPDLVTATKAWRECQGACDFVTSSGESLNRHGVYSGGDGASQGATPSSLLARKNLVAEIEKELGALQQEIGELSRHKGGLQSDQTALLAGLQQAQDDLRAHEVAMATRQGELNALRSALRVLHQKIDTVVFEIQSLGEQQREGDERRAVLDQEIAAHETREAAIRQRLSACQVEIERSQSDRDQASAVLTETKVATATEEQVCASLRNQQRPLDQRLRELQQAVEERQRELNDAIQRKSRAETEINESKVRLDALDQERALVSRQVADSVAQRETQAGEIAAREEVLRNLRRQLTELQEKRSALDVEQAQRHMSIQNLRDRVLQRYQVNLDDVRSECITITFADEGPAKVVVLTPEEMAEAGVSTDWNAVAEQVAALQRKIEEMGPVNLVAIAEYEEIEQRHQTLVTQRDDLVQARSQLVEAINRVNAQTRTMFAETFNQVRENFRNLFVEVFEGGQADLYFSDDGDVLESGIEIEARPPGKQVQSISLLSGGEQAMTAVALLFAIYQVRPSPFCILDELDAPLDESNITRFSKVLRRFLARSQFIIVTHNKRTIGMADILYGITMQEQGVSKIVSVKLRKPGQVIADNDVASIETATPTFSLNTEEELESRKSGPLELAGVN